MERLQAGETVKCGLKLHVKLLSAWEPAASAISDIKEGCYEPLIG